MFGKEHHHHHRSPFPLIVILLSMALIVFMFFAFTDNGQQEAKTNFEQTIAVTDKGYQKELTSVIKDFYSSQETSESDLEILISVEQTLSTLLSMKVPAEQKSLHLELALSLNMMQSGLKSEERNGDEGFERFKKTVSRFSWIEL
jgi:hypothetical protein